MCLCHFKLALLSLPVCCTDCGMCYSAQHNKCFIHVALFMHKCYRLLSPISTNLLNNYQHVSSWLRISDTPIGHATQMSCCSAVV